MRITFDEQHVLVCDGAMGTMIQNSGLDRSVCPELWNELRPDVIEHIHKAYVESGAEILETNTFGGSPLKLKEYGLEEKAYDLCKQGAEIARRAAKDKALVAGSVGPTGALFKPMGTTTFEQAYQSYLIQMQGLVDGGVDMILIETMMEITELKAALLAAKQVAPDMVVVCQMTFTENGTTIMGTTPEIAATVLTGLGAHYVGVNCSTGPEGLLDVVRKMGQTTELPLSVQPNAGLPEMEGEETVYRESPEHMASFVARFVESGAKIVGGCCGSTPAHIAAIAREAKNCKYSPRKMDETLLLCSRNRLVRLEGESIKVARLLQDEETKLALEEKRVNDLHKILRKQLKAGAQCISVELSEEGLDEEFLEALMLGFSGPLSVPLLFSAKLGSKLEYLLRLATGNSLIIDVQPQNLDTLMPLAKHYGAGLVVNLGEKDILTTWDSVTETAKQEGFRLSHLLADLSVLLQEQADTSVLTAWQGSILMRLDAADDIAKERFLTLPRQPDLLLADYRLMEG